MTRSTVRSSIHPIVRENKNISYHFADVDGVRVFYREAGDKNKPVILLLHGFPSSSHQYRQLIPLLATHFHVLAPDFPGFGFTEVPEQRKYVYSFDNLANTLSAWVEYLNLKKYILYIFDYGAPTGLRLALHAPERIAGIVSQNGNAYVDGFGEVWAPIKAYWQDPSEKNRRIVCEATLNLHGIRWQYIEGVREPMLVAPESYLLDTALIERVGNQDIQLDLFFDYQNNIKLYPQFQAFFRASHVKTLVIWGKNDPFFIPPGAEAYRRDNPNAEVELLDTGHFALETHGEYIAHRIIATFSGS